MENEFIVELEKNKNNKKYIKGLEKEKSQVLKRLKSLNFTQRKERHELLEECFKLDSKLGLLKGE